MIYLILAILSSTGVSLALRFSNNSEHSLYGKLVCNYLTCVLCSLMYSPINSWHGSSFGFGLFNGILLVAGLLLMQRSILKNGMALTSLYGRLGVCVPLVFSLILFKEIPTVFQIGGMILSIVSILLFFYQSKINFRLGLGLLFYMFMCGLSDMMNKIYQYYGIQKLSGQYLLVSFLLAAMLSLMLMIFHKEKLTKKEVFYGLMIGIPNYYSSHFLLLSLNDLSSLIVYPTFALMTIMTISLCGYVFFKENLNKEMIMTFVLIMISIGLLNM